jgi:HK97 family phage portal protein
MGFWSKVLSWVPRNNFERVWRELYAGQPAASGISVTPDSAMRCAAVYACVRVLAESVAQLPRQVYQRDADGGRTKFPGHPLYPLLNQQPNEWQTSFEFFEMLMGFLCLRGNAYAHKNIVRGQVVELIPLHPDCMQVKQLPDYTLVYTYTPPAPGGLSGGEAKVIPTNEIMHIRGLSSNGYMGLNPIQAYREAVGLSLAMERHGAKLFANGAKPGGVITVPGTMNEKAQQNLRESIEAIHAGPENAHKTMILEQGAKWDGTGMTSEDSQFIESRKFQRGDIASIFRVQPHKIGDLERATFSNIEQQSLEFVTDSLMPWIIRFEQVFQRDLIAPRDQASIFVKFNLDALLRGDTKSRYEANNLGISGGWKTRNECRMQEDLNPIEGLDEILTPMNMAMGADPGKLSTPPADPGKGGTKPAEEKK